ncbi:MFS transporter [Desulfogranum mediterraneum]|uniref:MFS transporter n=1 Tax=Desulfogranum mediterraneum TaxID=160661 RepID=UPI0003F9F0BD|nr:MFS transporter [Desulfogranum mediterraneum]
MKPSQTTVSEDKDRFQLGRVLTLSICHFIHDAYTSFLAPLLPLLIEKLSMSLTQAGLLTTVMQIPALLNPYLGSLADKVSVRYFIIFAPGVTAICMSLIGVAPNYATLVLLFFIAGISVALFHVPAPVLIYRYSGMRKGLGMSFFMTGGELARTLGPLVAIGAVSLLGLENIAPLMVVGIAASLLLYFRFQHVPVAKRANHSATMKDAWQESRHIFRPLGAILFFRGFMHASGATFLPTFVNEYTGSLWLAGISLTVYESAGVLGAMSCGHLSDRFGRRRLLLLTLLSAPPFLFAFVLLNGFYWLQLITLFGLGFTLLSTTPVMLAMVQEHAPDHPATANGFFMMISFLARSAVVVLVGAIADLIGLGNTYLFSAALGLGAIPFILSLPGEVQRLKEEPAEEPA